ncbi:cyclopropane-fatty-acyl-phospholipid synthase family protein [Actinomadura sp. NEAU-AAG7]|uniref:SAM-dependent methyltransferase n=1 Tax=Actinomadura sp. NEAU-AAG7 TaxID=2839640 RepID=UPI001BE4B58F|nr:class I SAM-dependent methyltransferase [Actinomadura sp. NEAU-AAG7]MBT2209392.1 class I SAM-dependent methyltransferase [Actinomadura sp. NEAU-AAG7]
MNREQISAAAHARHPIAGPLEEASVRRLLDRAAPERGRVLDLGCNTGAWLLRALDGRPGLRADGVDLDEGALATGRARAAEAGLGDRVAFHLGDARAFTSSEPYDLVLSVGAAHAFGGLMPTLAAARGHLAPGGAVLAGDGFWEREPGRAALDAGFTADEYAGLPATADRIAAAGWTIVYAHVSTRHEWDDYEWSWTGALAQWGIDHPEDRADAFAAADEHRRAWLHGYRGTLGFVTFVLRETP